MALSGSAKPSACWNNVGFWLFHIHREGRPFCFSPSLKAPRYDGQSDEAYDDHETWAIVIGRLRNKNRNPKTWEIEPWSGEGPRPEGVYELTIMLVEKHAYSLYHRVGMEKEIDERVTVGWEWKFREFSVGGPGRGERVRFEVVDEGLNYV